jgi:hypothetical protein
LHQRGIYPPPLPDAAGKEHARHFDRKFDAQRWLDGVTSSVVTGTYVEPRLARVTVGEWGRRWLDGHAALKPSTRGRYESLMRVHIVPRWGTTPIRAVNVADVEDWLSAMIAAGLSASSVRQAYRVLSLILDHAVRPGRLARNPGDGRVAAAGAPSREALPEPLRSRAAGRRCRPLPAGCRAVGLYRYPVR